MTTSEARPPSVAQGGASCQRHVRRRRDQRRVHNTDVPIRRSREACPSSQRWPHNVRVAPAATTVTRGASYEGRRFAPRFRRPSVTNFFDPVASAASSGDDLLQSFVYAYDCWLSPY